MAVLDVGTDVKLLGPGGPILPNQVHTGACQRIGVQALLLLHTETIPRPLRVIDESHVAAEAALDGIYIVRTSLKEERLSAEDTVRSYKRLSQVERAFRSIKTMDLKVRPIYHYLEPRVRAHLFLCMLAYYVEWHMREAWRPLLFCDEDQEAKSTRDPVAPAERSDAALEEIHTKHLPDGTAVHSFQSLIHSLSGIVLNLACVPGTNGSASIFEIVTTPNETQQQAMELLKNIQM